MYLVDLSLFLSIAYTVAVNSIIFVKRVRRYIIRKAVSEVIATFLGDEKVQVTVKEQDD